MTIVHTPAQLAQMVHHLRSESAFALDTESNSFFAYYPKVCLIQITTFSDSHKDGGEGLVDYIVDPMRLNDLGPLRDLVATGEQEVVMHAAENDVLQLQRDFGMRFPRVFDTQLAARILGIQRVGLAAMLEETFGVVSDKRMQRTDWTRRPLSPQQLAYAVMDTHYLLRLRDLLSEQLLEAGRWEEAQEAFANLNLLDADGRTPMARTFWNMKVTHGIDLSHTGVLEALWEWREREAQRLDRPPFKVMSDEALGALAEQRPTTSEELRSMGTLTDQQSSRYGSAILAVIDEGASRSLPALPRGNPRPESLLAPADQARFERLRRWRTERARVRGVAPEIVFSNDTLLEIVQRAPATHDELLAMRGIGPWKVSEYGNEVLALLNGREGHRLPSSHEARPSLNGDQ